jgi:outer membrane receptor protein involved in Fe transport
VTSRDEGGAYGQDEFLVSEHFRWVFGGRIDKFENLKGAVFSPRTTFVLKPTARQTFRLSYNRAYVAPSVINNYIRLFYVLPIQLSGPTPFPNPIHIEGNPDLKEKSLNAYEIGYTAIVAKGRANVGAAFYVNDGKGWFYSPVVAYYSSADPPPGWPLPPAVLDYLIAKNQGLPKTVRSDNLGKVRNKGLELSADVQISRFVNGYANYSWQALPYVKDPAEISYYNKPPAHRFNAGMRFDYRRYFGNASVSYVDDTVWNDVPPWWRGPTKGYTTINFGVGKDWGENRKYATILKVSNLANTPIQNHIFGDILKRQITGEFKIRF